MRTNEVQSYLKNHLSDCLCAKPQFESESPFQHEAIWIRPDRVEKVVAAIHAQWPDLSGESFFAAQWRDSLIITLIVSGPASASQDLVWIRSSIDITSNKGRQKSEVKCSGARATWPSLRLWQSQAADLYGIRFGADERQELVFLPGKIAPMRKGSS